MKKFFLFFALIGSFTATAFADEPDRSVVPSDNQPVEVTVLSVSNSAVEFLVEANNVVYEVCDYFNGSWLDTGLKIYCTFGGDVYTCTTYKITKMACSISGAVKLYMEGDFNNSLKKILTTGAEIWVMSKAGSKINLAPSSNMCPAN